MVGVMTRRSNGMSPIATVSALMEPINTMNQTGSQPISAPMNVPSCDELVKRAQALLPQLRARAEAAEQARRLPEETMQDFFAAGFHRIMQPPRFGGYGYGHDVAVEVIMTIASGCGSSGWVASLAAMHNWQVALFPLEAQQEYWAESQDVFSSTGSFAPGGGKLETVAGGYRLSGRWKFASGADFASWFMIMKPTNECLDWMLVPRKDVTMVDDWFVSGLCATGSKDIVLDQAFVPSHRVLAIGDLLSGRCPGGPTQGSPFSRLPFQLAAVWGLPAALIGMVAGMTEAFQSTLVGKRILFTGEKQVERVANQIKLTEAHTDVHAAQLVMRHRLQKVKEWGIAGGAPDAVDALSSQRDAAYVARLAAKIATGVSLAAGANSAYRSNPIQRFLRDVMVGANHTSLVWEEIAEYYGRAKWGLPPKLPATSAT